MSAEEKRCDWSDLYVSQCSHCQGLDVPHDLPRVGPTAGTPAGFTGRCGECGNGIDVGDMIEQDRVTGSWLHAGCM